MITIGLAGLSASRGQAAETTIDQTPAELETRNGAAKLAKDTVSSLCREAARMSSREFLGACNLAQELMALQPISND
jgi:hypothetical protein